MNLLWPRFLKLAYRKEPISSFVAVVGAVEAVIGGIDESWSLLSFGLGTVVVALALRWLQNRSSTPEDDSQPPKYFLPSQSERPALPMLNAAKRRPPN